MEYKHYTVHVYEDKTIWFNEKGQYHREDGPAIEYVNGTKEWFINDRRHREDGPARIYSNGKVWYKRDKLHRDNGPAIEDASGSKYWYKNGELHREDGPALECVNGTKEWYLNNKKYTEEEYNKKMKKSSCNGKIVEIEGKKYRLVEEK
jgi:hypothetical protein